MVITLIKILLLGRVVLLTPEPITIEKDCVDIIPNKPLEAVTAGASIQIDVSAMFEESEWASIKTMRDEVQRVVPKGSVMAQLYGKEGGDVKLYYKGNTSIRAEEINITLNNPNGVPTDYSFHKLRVCADILLNNVTLSWKNYQH